MTSTSAVPADPPPMPRKSSISRDVDSNGFFADQKNPSASSTAHDTARAPAGAENGPSATSPVSPSDAARGAGSGRELLRRLSLMGTKAAAPSTMTRPEEHADLRLSGRIISATFCIPYKLQFRTGYKWELSPRPGTSALFDAFENLASPENPWSHTLVGWTGEIEKSTQQESYFEKRMAAGPEHDSLAYDTARAPLSKASAPIPVDATQKPPPPPVDGLYVTKDDRNRLEGQLHSSQYGKILPVWLGDGLDSPDQKILLKDQARWRRYAERELYPLFHYKKHGPTDGRAERHWWQDYQRMNQHFADRILEVYQPGDVVWIHDYHLFLLPSLLRQRIPGIYIGFFLHVPFPSSEFFRCLTRRKEILTGVLGSNMVGFQSFTYSRHFSSCCTRILRFESNSAGIDAYGAHVAVDVFPIGIDADAVRRMAYGEPNIEKTIAEIKKLYSDKKIIIGRDRLDSARGVTQKLQAFEMFLERYPEWRDKVVLIQVTSPTNIEEENEKSESKLATQVSHLVSTINGKYGSLSFAPVQYYPQHIPRHEYFALLRAADVGLITSVRDGMNTTSLEYVVCQHENHGPLILSEFSGTAGSLHDAIHINPWDSGGIAKRINEALTMSPEKRREQHEALYKYVTTNTVSRWADQYVRRLLTNLSSFNQSIATPLLDRQKLIDQYCKARRRLFMFDYDGTLTPIVKDPQAAIPSDRVVRTLKSLAADPKNSVWIISGRDQNFLEEWMGHIPELGLSAEHGSFIRKPHSEIWENLTETIDMGWQKEVLDIFQHYTERTQGSFVERKRVALTWHYRRVDPEYGAYQAKECRKHLEETVTKKWPVEIMAGKANLEVRPTFVNKGEIASRLVHECQEPPEFVLCLGDDFTDEDMFRALRRSNLPAERVFSVTVGASSKQTEATWHLLEPSDVIATVGLLNNCCD